MLVNPTEQLASPNPSILNLPWGSDNKAKVWELIVEVSKPANYKIVFGNKDISEDSRVAAFTHIGEVLWPEHSAVDKKLVTSNTKNKFEWLRREYRYHLIRLMSPGRGLEGDSDGGVSSQLNEESVNSGSFRRERDLWARIVSEFEFFPALYELLSIRPDDTPICITTGISPTGIETIYAPPPSSIIWPLDNPEQGFLNRSFTSSIASSSEIAQGIVQRNVKKVTRKARKPRTLVMDERTENAISLSQRAAFVFSQARLLLKERKVILEELRAGIITLEEAQTSNAKIRCEQEENKNFIGSVNAFFATKNMSANWGER